MENRTIGPEFSIISDTAADVWHPTSGNQAYEWWYFDALSDDGRDAVVIIFFDNFVFSPRYNKLCAEQSTSKTSETSQTPRFPGVAFFYYRDGKPIYRCINEFDASQFTASTEKASAQIGDSGFYIGEAPYGPGYGVTVEGTLRGGKRLHAKLEWVAIESNVKLGAAVPQPTHGKHNWNLAVPRADVSGKITVDDASGKNSEVIHFRGSGYHDHNHDSRWLPDAVADWRWGRAHFNDTTVVYYDYISTSGERITKLVTVKDGDAKCEDASVIERGRRRDVFGIGFPSSMTFETESGTRLTVFNRTAVDSSFFYLRHINDAVLTLTDGIAHKGPALCERLAPRALRWRWLDWLVDMRIGRDGRAAFLK